MTSSNPYSFTLGRIFAPRKPREISDAGREEIAVHLPGTCHSEQSTSHFAVGEIDRDRREEGSSTESLVEPGVDGAEINHEELPPRRREVPLLELLRPGRLRKVCGNFEVIPSLQKVVVLDPGREIDIDEGEWEVIQNESGTRCSASRTLANRHFERSYAEVAKAHSDSEDLD